ncbi:hypothetical protein L873DRAFT_1302040 [Choiromyces venosus 120613-1]|uniref:Uncharacterized protein n=1 Tax=Choiromyces venosus 120613-1 TaxID=1336337 RepID=A0A3N4JGU1_9PEZI|nr:hypothetical protein L873DRAFT_1302040 [Choiromyces venosus 120613-1]
MQGNTINNWARYKSKTPHDSFLYMTWQTIVHPFNPESSHWNYYFHCKVSPFEASHGMIVTPDQYQPEEELLMSPQDRESLWSAWHFGYAPLLAWPSVLFVRVQLQLGPGILRGKGLPGTLGEATKSLQVHNSIPGDSTIRVHPMLIDRSFA